MTSRHQLLINSPLTLEEAYDLRQGRESGCFLAGGTDLIPLMQKGLNVSTGLIDLSRIESLNRIEHSPEGLHIGAMVTLSELAGDNRIGAEYPALAKAAGLVGSPQIRTVATVGGNLGQDRRCIYFNQSGFWRQSLEPCFKTGGTICHQKPTSPDCRAIFHSDLAPVLLALEARACLFGAQGHYEQPLTEFIHDHVTLKGGVGSGRVILTGVIIPAASSRAWSRFVKHSVRSAVDFALINAALAWHPSGSGGSAAKASFFVGAVAPEPIEMIETQRLLESGPGGGDDWKAACMESAITEISQKSAMILDTGIGLKARNKALGLVGLLAGRLAEYLCSEPEQ